VNRQWFQVESEIEGVILKADRKAARPHRLDDRILCSRAVAVGCAVVLRPHTMQTARPHRLFCNFKYLFVFVVLCAVDVRSMCKTACRIRRSTLVNSAVSECKLTTVNDDYDDWVSRTRQVMRRALSITGRLRPAPIPCYVQVPHTAI